VHRRSLTRRYAALLTAVAAVLAGCTSGPDPVVSEITSGPATGDGRAGDTAAAPPLQHTPVAVAGIESCAALPQHAPSRAAAGDRLPGLELPCLVPGPAVDLSAMGGRPVLVNLWATWCGPCREEMPLLQAAHLRHGEDVQFLGVNTEDTTEVAAAFLPDVGVTYPQLVDLDGNLLDHLRIPGLPVTVLLHPDGSIAAQHIGALTPDTLEDLLAKAS
jgi:cytochrome c biogenesis protein CcmG/thiol:disulfide interchange protein DsbE